MILYNLFPLLAGKFSAWPAHIDRAAELECDWIFVNPVQKPGGSGSLYSIADYFELNPRLIDADSALSPEQQLKNSIRYAEERGLKVMVDLVINHCASDSALAQQHPEWFVHEDDGSIAHPWCLEDEKKVVWGDLIRFDHENTSDPEGLYRYFHAIVEYLTGLGFRGFRCDAAYQIPGVLWQRLIEETKHHTPDTLFAAETLGCTPKQTSQTAAAGFDYVFNSSKWWDFESDWLLEQYDLTREATPSISFPESHDTVRLIEEAEGNVNALKQRYLFAATFSAGVMLPMGFEFAFKKPLHVVETRPEDWEEVNVDLRDYIRDINAIKKRYPIFGEESINEVIPSENPEILLLHKKATQSGQRALIVLNKDLEQTQRFQTADLDQFIDSKKPLHLVLPAHTDTTEEASEAPDFYTLEPGQGLVMVTQDP